jgi:hypothetical protein
MILVLGGCHFWVAAFFYAHTGQREKLFAESIAFFAPTSGLLMRSLSIF